MAHGLVRAPYSSCPMACRSGPVGHGSAPAVHCSTPAVLGLAPAAHGLWLGFNSPQLVSIGPRLSSCGSRLESRSSWHGSNRLRFSSSGSSSMVHDSTPSVSGFTPVVQQYWRPHPLCWRVSTGPGAVPAHTPCVGGSMGLHSISNGLWLSSSDLWLGSSGP